MLKAFVTIGVLQLLTMILQVVRTKTLAVTLGPEWLGVMGAVDRLTAVIVQTVSLSFPFAAVRFLPRLWTSDREEFRRVLAGMRNVLALTVTVATTAAAALTFVVPRVWGRELAPYGTAVLAATATLPALAFLPFLQNVLAGRLRESQAMGVALANAVLLTAAAVLGGRWFGLVGYYTVYAVLGLALTLIVVRVIGRGLGTAADAPRLGLTFALPRAVWQFTGVIFALAFLTPYAALYVYTKVLSAEGARVAGWMQAAIGVSLIVRVGLGSAHGVLLIPNVNTDATARDRVAWAFRFQAVLAMLAGVAVPLLVLFPDIVVKLLYSSELAPGARFAGAFVLAEFIWLTAASSQPLILALDHLRFHVLQNMAVQLLLVAVAALTVSRFGVAGAASANLIANSALYLSTLIFLRVRYAERLPRPVAVLTWFVIASIAVAAAIGVRWPTVSWEAAAGKLGVYFVLVACLVPLLSETERAEVVSVVARLRTRLQPASR